MALTYRTQSSISSVIPATTQIRGMATDGTDLYVRTNENSGRTIKKFSLTGAYDSSGDITLPLPTRQSSSDASRNPNLIGFAYAGGKFYVMYDWPTTGGATNIGFARYSNNFTFEANIGNQLVVSHQITDFDVDANYIYFYLSNANAINRINVRTGAFTTALSALASNVLNVEVTPDRVLLIRPNDIQAYTLAGVSVNGDDVTLPGDLGNSQAAAYVDGNLYLVDNNSELFTFGEILLEGTYTGNFGGLSLHANFLVDETNVHVVHNNVIQDFALTKRGGNPLAFVRHANRDVTLVGHPTSIVTWGFTESHFGSHDGEWVILTRERSTALGTIGKVRVYNHAGTEKMLEFDIPSVVPGINTAATPMRAPKTISEFYGFYIVRVVRGGTGNMRFLVFDQAGKIRPELTITLQSSTPTTLRDAATETDSPLYIASRGTPVGTAVAFHPGTGAELMGERVAGAELAQVDGISIYRHHLYAATLTSITEYSNIPLIPNPLGSSASGGASINFGLLQAIVANGFMEGNMNRRNRR